MNNIGCSSSKPKIRKSCGREVLHCLQFYIAMNYISFKKVFRSCNNIRKIFMLEMDQPYCLNLLQNAEVKV